MDIFRPGCVSGLRCIHLEVHPSRIFLEFCNTILHFRFISICSPIQGLLSFSSWITRHPRCVDSIDSIDNANTNFNIYIAKKCFCIACFNNYISNKSPTRCKNFSAQNFRMFSRPLSEARWLLFQPLALPSYCGYSRAVFVVGPTTNTARLSPRYEGETTGCHYGRRFPDNGRENVRNMLSCKETSG